MIPTCTRYITEYCLLVLKRGYTMLLGCYDSSLQFEMYMYECKVRGGVKQTAPTPQLTPFVIQLDDSNKTEGGTDHLN